MIARIVTWTLSLVLGVLFVIALFHAAQADVEHNRRQLAECRALGGFAKTNVDGTLINCTFPPVQR